MSDINIFVFTYKSQFGIYLSACLASSPRSNRLLEFNMEAKFLSKKIIIWKQSLEFECKLLNSLTKEMDDHSLNLEWHLLAQLFYSKISI